MQCPRETPGWSFRSSKDGTLDVLVAAIEHVIAENPIDEKRITATGVSSGGWGVWELILRHPDMFAEAVPTACGAPQAFQRLAALKNTPVWLIFNAGDRQVNH
jgi:predicted peptidase